MTVYNWLVGLGFPESAQQFKDLTTDSADQRDPKEAYCDGTLRILNSNLREIAQVKFQDLFPVSLTSLDFDSSNTDIEYFTAEATFRYTIYDLISTIR